YCFFFSSRRRHTRSTRDWSSDVCSSDLHFARSSLSRPISKRTLKTSKPTFLRIATGRTNILRSSRDGTATAVHSVRYIYGLYIYTMLEARSEEHTSELQSRVDLVCRLLLE